MTAETVDLDLLEYLDLQNGHLGHLAQCSESLFRGNSWDHPCLIVLDRYYFRQ